MGNSQSRSAPDADSSNFFHSISTHDVAGLARIVAGNPMHKLEAMRTSLSIKANDGSTIIVENVTPLHAATLSSRHESFNFLLERNFPAIANSRGESPLHLAASRLDLFKLEKLLENHSILKEYRNDLGDWPIDVFDRAAQRHAQANRPPIPGLAAFRDRLLPADTEIQISNSVIESLNDDIKIFRRHHIRSELQILLIDKRTPIIPGIISIPDHQFLAFVYPPELAQPYETQIMRIFTAELLLKKNAAGKDSPLIRFGGPAANLRSALSRPDAAVAYTVAKVATLKDISLDTVFLVCKIILARFREYSKLQNNCRDFARFVFQSLLAIYGSSEPVHNLAEILATLQNTEALPQETVLNLVSIVTRPNLPLHPGSGPESSSGPSSSGAPILTGASTVAGYQMALPYDQAEGPSERMRIPLEGIRNVSKETSVIVLDQTLSEVFDGTFERDTVYLARRHHPKSGFRPLSMSSQFISIMYLTTVGGSSIARVFDFYLGTDVQTGCPCLVIEGPICSPCAPNEGLNIIEAVALSKVSFNNIKFVAQVLLTRYENFHTFSSTSADFAIEHFLALRNLYAYKTPLLSPVIFSAKLEANQDYDPSALLLRSFATRNTH